MPIPLATVQHYAPIFHFHENERFFPCDIDFLLSGSTLQAADGSPIKSNPSQEDLVAGTSDGGATRHVAINSSQWQGLPLQGGEITSPIYYAVQDFGDVTVIHYLLLFAYQGGQTCRALRVWSEFNCIVNDFGIHQGDLERVAVALSPDGSQVLAVEYEAHGDIKTFAPSMVNWVEDARGRHPVVHVALNGHSLHNLAREENPVSEDEVPGAVRIVSECGTGTVWDPAASSEFRLLAMSEGQPVGTERWAQFAGRLGISQDNSLESATYYDGSNLSGVDWTFVKMVDFLAVLSGKYPEDIRHGNGPVGPGGRAWVTQPAPGTNYYGADMTVLWNSGDLGQGPGAIAFLTGRFFDIEKDSIIQFWNDGGQACAIGYGLDDGGNLVVLSTSSLGQGPGAVGWLKGRFRGSEVEQAIQLWDNGSLGMILYGVGDSGTIESLWANGDMGQGPGANQWIVGDFSAAGEDQILQCWDNGGQLGMILYGADGGGGLTCTWAESDMGEGSGAVEWATGDFNGDGRAEVMQCWSNGGSLGIILWGSDGNGGMKRLWRSDDVGQGSGAVQWLVGDFDGDGRDELVQCWDNGSLGMILYGADASNAVTCQWTSADMGQGPGAVCWLAGDFAGDGKDRILQCWDNGALGMIVYGSNGSGGLGCLWASENMGEGPGAVNWSCGNFSPSGRDRVVQLWNNGSIGAIQYGTIVQD